MKALHNSCNKVTCALPDMYTLSPRVYISGRALVPVLQLLYNQILLLGINFPIIHE